MSQILNINTCALCDCFKRLLVLHKQRLTPVKCNNCPIFNCNQTLTYLLWENWSKSSCKPFFCNTSPIKNPEAKSRENVACSVKKKDVYVTCKFESIHT